MEELSPGWDSEELDPVEVAYFSLPGIGMPPKPTLDGMTRRAAKAVVVVAPHAWRLAGDTLSTDCAPEAFALAERLAREAPDVITSGRALTWARAIAWVLGTRPEFESLTATKLAEELGSTPATMRAKAVIVRRALGLKP